MAGTWVSLQTWINPFSNCRNKRSGGNGTNVLYAKSNLDYDASLKKKDNVWKNLAS
jgi:hypothetical protein